MEIQTTVLKAALLRFSTNIDATGVEYDKLSLLADKLAEQIRGVVEAHGGQMMPDGGFAMGTASAEPVTLDLDAKDVNNLAACCERITWPFSRFTSDMKTAVQALRKVDLPAWMDQAEIEMTLERMTPAQRQALAERAAQ